MLLRVDLSWSSDTIEKRDFFVNASNLVVVGKVGIQGHS
jgi:hypothetical protein